MPTTAFWMWFWGILGALTLVLAMLAAFRGEYERMAWMAALAAGSIPLSILIFRARRR